MAKMTMDEIGFSLSDDEEKEINAAAGKQPVVDYACQEMTMDMLNQFKRMNRTKLPDIKNHNIIIGQ